MSKRGLNLKSGCSDCLLASGLGHLLWEDGASPACLVEMFVVQNRVLLCFTESRIAELEILQRISRCCARPQ